MKAGFGGCGNQYLLYLSVTVVSVRGQVLPVPKSTLITIVNPVVVLVCVVV